MNASREICRAASVEPSLGMVVAKRLSRVCFYELSRRCLKEGFWITVVWVLILLATATNHSKAYRW